MRPVSSIVTCTWIGTSRPTAAIARRAPIIAALRPSRSNWVSTRSRSTPPSSRPRHCSSYASRSSAKRIWPSDANLVPGPIEPATQRAVAVGDLAGDAGGLEVDLVGLVGDAVLAERHGERAERGGLDDVDADLEVVVVHLGDDVGPGEHEHLVAALERGPAEVVGGQVLLLHAGAEGPVVDDDPLAAQRRG